MIGSGTADAPVRTVGLELSARSTGVEYLTDLGAARGELATRSLDIGDDQVQTLG